MSNESLESRIKEAYRKYSEIISPFIVFLETEDEEFPVEIINEIRAFTTHMARYTLATDAFVKAENVEMAERHIKRAILDCFKYSCFTISEKHNQLRNDYRNADIHLIDNGTYLSQLIAKEQAANEQFLKARKSEINGKTDADGLYELYESAYQAKQEAYDFLKDSIDKLEFAASVADKNKKLAIGGLIVGIAGAIFGLIGMVVAFL